MKKVILSSMIVLSVVLHSCTAKKESGAESTKVDSTAIQTAKKMKNLVSIVEIPVSDFKRAVAFYQIILDIKIEEMDMGGVQMGVLPGNGETVNVVLAKGGDYKPTTDGALIYLNAGEDLQAVAARIEANGGKILVPKTEISPEMGFFALFTDTEGNKLGLHSSK